jgi:hypothetical protein
VAPKKGVTEMLSKILLTTVLVSGLIMPAGVIVPRAKAEGQTVVINELLWMGSSTSSADEWIELRNLTDQAVDLSNWTKKMITLNRLFSRTG